MSRTRSSAATGFFFALRSLSFFAEASKDESEGGFALRSLSFFAEASKDECEGGIVRTGKIEKEVIMWFLIIVLLLIRILNTVNKNEEINEDDFGDLENNRVVHPAEYLMR